MGDYIAALGLDQYDGMYNPGGLFGRDQDRLNSGYALEHTAYFDGTKFASYVQSQEPGQIFRMIRKIQRLNLTGWMSRSNRQAVTAPELILISEHKAQL